MRRNIPAVFCLAIAGFGLAGCNRSADAASNSPTAAPVVTSVIDQGTSFRVRLQETLDTRRNRAGDSFTAVLDEPLVSGDKVVVPKGTLFHGHITQARPSGRFRGRAFLGLKLDSFTLDGRDYDIQSTDFARASKGHTKHALAWIGGGAGGGALIGGAAAGGAGALIGAGAGAAAGTVGSALTGKRDISLPVETVVRFTLQDAVEVAR